MDRKNALLEVLEYSYTQESAFATSLSAAERAEIGTLENWSAKDILAHCAAWQARLAGNLAAVALGAPTLRTDDLDRANAEFFHEHQVDSLEKIMEDLSLAYQALAGQVRRLNQADLNSSEILPWQRSRPLWRMIAGNGALHPITHLTNYYAQKGRGKQAIQLYQAAMPLFSALDDGPAWRGLVLYDLACVYALAGQKSKAIDALKEALHLEPEFAEWAQQNSDLESLREETEFRELFKG
jgi:tetratricopeptide (TPR) repeat protein